MAQAKTPRCLHASAVAVGSAGLLILGKSGSGKSSLSMELMALGGTLVADDQVQIDPRDDGLLMTAPPRIDGRIEARSLGILHAPAHPAWARFVVDMDQTETERLPPTREIVIAGVTLKLLYRVESRSFPSMLYLLLKGGAA